MNKECYISVPISGRDMNEVRKRVERMKAQVEKMGYEAVSPLDLAPEKDKPYSYYMGRDIEALLECYAVIFADDYICSKGCMLEMHAAHIYGKEKLYED